MTALKEIRTTVLWFLIAWPGLIHAQNVTPKDLIVDHYGAPMPFNLGGDLALAYELHLTNPNSFPIRIEEIQVLSIPSLDLLQTLAGADLNEDVIGHLGVRPESEQIPVLDGGRRALAFLLPTLGEASPFPDSVTHRIRFSWEIEGGGYGKKTQETLALSTDRQSAPVTIGPPVSGGVWFVGNCVDSGRLGHRGPIYSASGSAVAPQRFAIDLIKLNQDGKMTTVADPVENHEFFTYGAEILAVADGRVVKVLEGVPENEPFSRLMPIPMTRENMPGNHIILDIGSGHFAFYAHLVPGSILVEEGSLVKKGQPIALLGNSGRSDAPHLHFHIAGSADLRAAQGLPFSLEAFEYLGKRDLLEMVNNSDALWRPDPGTPSSRLMEMPKSDWVIRIGG